MLPLFGTDGIRKKVGQEPLTREGLAKLGSALSQWLVQKKAGTILLGHDTRASSHFCKASIKSGLLSLPVKVYDSHVTPTPVIAHRLSHKEFQLGIMITASHNGFADNGIKLFTPAGKMTSEEEKEITTLFYKNTPAPNYINLGKEIMLSDTFKWYEQMLKEKFPQNFLKGLKIVVDCANGAFSFIGPDMLRRFGAEVIAVAVTPNGKNINEQSGSLFPETVKREVFNHRADLGFAFDGDGDRLAVVTRDGAVKDGDDLLALLSQHEAYKDQATIVGTVMSNQGMVSYLAKQNKQLIRCPVGDKNVISRLKKEKGLLGGEVSGHTILGDFGYTADALITALRIIEVIKETDNWQLTSFQKFPQVTMNLPITQKKNLADAPFADLIEQYSKSLKGGRLLIRYSGTEPVLRLMVETVDLKQAQEVGLILSQKLTRMLQS